MEWVDDAIVLNSRRHGENSLILSLLTREHGRCRGLVRGGASSKQRGQYEPGNLVTATWRARLSEHLGNVRVEAGIAYAASMFDDPLRLACLEAATQLAEAAMPERAAHPVLFAALAEVLERLGADSGYAAAHLHWEVRLLAELGYGLDLASCAVTGATGDLAWISPRTGRAVSAGVGAAYRDRLLVFPRALGGIGAGGTDVEDMLDGLKATGTFIERFVLAPKEQDLPPGRTRYIDRLGRLVAISRNAEGK